MSLDSSTLFIVGGGRGEFTARGDKGDLTEKGKRFSRLASFGVPIVDRRKIFAGMAGTFGIDGAAN